MAVDYTKIFTVMGSLVDKVNNYYAYIGTFNTDKTALDAILSAQSVVYLEDGLTDIYDTFKSDVSGWTDVLIGRVTEVLTDEALIGANFSFGAAPSLTTAFPALIRDMALTDKNVTASVITVGTLVYTTSNSTVGKAVVKTVLDGSTPPRSGAMSMREYHEVTSQMAPTSETLTLTCTSDSETGGTRGSEVFEITGTGPPGTPYSPDGENVGRLGSITVSDNRASRLLANPSFDGWAADAPSSWTVVAGTAGTHFDEDDTNTLTGSGSAFKFVGASTAQAITISQELNINSFERMRAYMVTMWARKLTDALADQQIDLRFDIDTSTVLTLSTTPTTTSWVQVSAQLFIPEEMETLEVFLKTNTNMDSDLKDPVLIDQIVITPCEYIAGVAIAVYGGPEKFLLGDTIDIPLSNDNAGVFQTFFRKAYGIQLPTDATPTISDSLVT